MNPVERALYQELTQLLDRLAGSVPEGSLDKIRAANPTLRTRLDDAASKHTVEWQWIKGHAGHEVQDIVDKTARKIAKTGKVDQETLDEAALGIGIVEI